MTAAGCGARRTVITAASVIPAFCRILITARVCVKWPVPVPQNAATNLLASTLDSSMPATGTTDLRLFARPVATLSTTFSTGVFHKLGRPGMEAQPATARCYKACVRYLVNPRDATDNQLPRAPIVRDVCFL